jgi:hypothetical protein
MQNIYTYHSSYHSTHQVPQISNVAISQYRFRIIVSNSGTKIRTQQKPTSYRKSYYHPKPYRKPYRKSYPKPYRKHRKHCKHLPASFTTSTFRRRRRRSASTYRTFTFAAVCHGVYLGSADSNHTVHRADYFRRHNIHWKFREMWWDCCHSSNVCSAAGICDLPGNCTQFQILFTCTCHCRRTVQA